MNPEQASLLQAILEHPDDDATRLVYADWLEENGDEWERGRVYFIRTCVAHERAPIRYEFRGAAPRGERILSGGHFFHEPWLKRFLVNLLHGFPFSDCVLTFTRGFMSEIRCPLATWIEYGAAIVRTHPVEIVTPSDKKPALAGHSWGWHTPVDVACEAADELPFPIHALLEGGTPGDGEEDFWIWYNSMDEAVDALSAACLALARQSARETISENLLRAH